MGFLIGGGEALTSLWKTGEGIGDCRHGRQREAVAENVPGKMRTELEIQLGWSGIKIVRDNQTGRR